VIVLVAAASFMAGAGFTGAAVLWAVFIGFTGKIIPDFGFGQEHPGDE
jgi:hypothetical protein